MGDLQDHPTHGYWKEKWTALLLKLGSSIASVEHEFLAQEKVTTLTLDNEFIGMHLLTTFNEADFTKHPYFAGYDQKFLDGLARQKVTRAQSMQYFFVDEAWSVPHTLINFGAIIGALSMRHHIVNNLDASVTIARADIAAASLAKKFGFDEISRTEMHNVPVLMLACFAPKTYPKEDVNHWAEYYWKHRAEKVIGDTTSKVA